LFCACTSVARHDAGTDVAGISRHDGIVFCLRRRKPLLRAIDLHEEHVGIRPSRRQLDRTAQQLLGLHRIPGGHVHPCREHQTSGRFASGPSRDSSRRRAASIWRCCTSNIVKPVRAAIEPGASSNAF
jgi:hypothetical protein